MFVRSGLLWQRWRRIISTFLHVKENNAGVIIVHGVSTASPRTVNATYYAFGSIQIYHTVYFRHLFRIKHS